MSTWTDQESTLGMRDVIAAIAENRIEALRPTPTYAVVQSINRENRSATVLHVGDPTPVTVALGSIEPAAVGQTVRIGGLIGHRYVEDVLGNAIMSGNDSRYAQTGHTHAGGGAVELDLNDLGDVDTETNPPGPDTVLGWNDIGHYWHPVSFDLGTEFLPLTGGTVTGPTTFTAALQANTTLTVLGQVTGQGFTGVGANLTQLNATALASGTIPAARMPSTIASNTTGTAASWTTGRLLTMSGDISGTVTIKGDADMTMSVALAANSIDLGTDTTGNYVEHIQGTANQIITNTVVATERAVHTLSLPQNIHVNAVPTFMRVNFGQTTGTAPMMVTSTTMVSNLTVENLGVAGQNEAFFRNASSLNAGNIASARVSGPYTGITGLGTLSTLTVAGVAALGNNSTVNSNIIWHAGNDGPGSGLDAGLLGGVLPAGYASTEIMESLMGDLLAVGLYDAAAYNGEMFSLIFNRPTHSQISGLTIAAGDHALEEAFAFDLPTIPQIDIAAGEQRRRLIRGGSTLEVVRAGDDDYLNRVTGYVSTPKSDDMFVNRPVVIRAKLRKADLDLAGIRQIARHGSSATDEAWTLYMDTGKLALRVSNNGSVTYVVDVLTFAELDAISNTADNSDFYVAVTIFLGETTLDVRGWGSVNGVAWTTAGITKSITFLYDNFFDSPAALNVGGITAGQTWDGRIYWVDMVAGDTPNTTDNPIWRFDAKDHPFGGGLTYVDLYGRSWTFSAANTVVHATYQAIAYLNTNAATLLGCFDHLLLRRQRRSPLARPDALEPDHRRPLGGLAQW